MRPGKLVLLLAAVVWTKCAYDIELLRAEGTSWLGGGSLWVPVAMFGWALCATLWVALYGGRRKH